ncbi:MAG: hypothetical protein VKS61_18195 [Candidatus Sericytochromatia bacterium]|nr:hypothetical protein [Candidatus Sericytochromatia bacterium]
MFLIIHSGNGLLAAVLGIALPLLINAMLTLVFGASLDPAQGRPDLAVSVLTTGCVLYLVGTRPLPPARVLLNPATGERLVRQPRHTLFWVPVVGWAGLYGAIGAVALADWWQNAAQPWPWGLAVAAAGIAFVALEVRRARRLRGGGTAVPVAGDEPGVALEAAPQPEGRA